MILADKITELRKKQGWSQEELAQRLNVSRQSVSKWESSASVPDLDKILKLGQLFDVSTDYLLKDTIDSPSAQAEPLPEEDPPAAPLRPVSLEEAHAYLEAVRATAGRGALGVALCILSPVALIFLSALSEEEGLPSRAIATGAGTTVLLVLVALGVSLFLLNRQKLAPYDYLEQEPIELLYGVTGMVRKEKAQAESARTLSQIIGVGLCILSAVPLMLAAAFPWEMAVILGLCLCLALIAAGVFLLVRSASLFGAYSRLLEEGDYTREEKALAQGTERLRKAYWCLVTALYLAWSFLTNNWDLTWILWPCAAVLFALVKHLYAALKKP